MARFKTSSRTRPVARPRAWAGLTEEQRAALPPRFEVIGEAQAAGSPSTEACREVGRMLADDGVTLQEALELLRACTQITCDREPSFAELETLSVAWSESTLGYLNRLSCENPLTGLATQAHLRHRLTELYRVRHGEADGVQDLYALVVIQVPMASDSMTRLLTLGRLGRVCRSVFSGWEVIGELGQRQIVILVARTPNLGQRVALLRTMAGVLRPRVWIEGLPHTDIAAGGLIDELARI